MKCQNKIEFNNARLFQMHFHVNLFAIASLIQQQKQQQHCCYSSNDDEYSGIHNDFSLLKMKCKFIFVKQRTTKKVHMRWQKQFIVICLTWRTVSRAAHGIK